MIVCVDHIRFCSPGAPGQQGVSERMEGAAGQEHQRGCVQPHAGGAGCGTVPLLPPDFSWTAETDQVTHINFSGNSLIAARLWLTSQACVCRKAWWCEWMMNLLSHIIVTALYKPGRLDWENNEFLLFPILV